MLIWLQMAGVQVDCRLQRQSGGWYGPGLLFLWFTSANNPEGTS